MPDVIIKLDKMLEDQLFFKFIIFNDFLRNLALKQCDPYMVTAVGIWARVPQRKVQDWQSTWSTTEDGVWMGTHLEYPRGRCGVATHLEYQNQNVQDLEPTWSTAEEVYDWQPTLSTENRMFRTYNPQGVLQRKVQHWQPTRSTENEMCWTCNPLGCTKNRICRTYNPPAVPQKKVEAWQPTLSTAKEGEGLATHLGYRKYVLQTVQDLQPTWSTADKGVGLEACQHPGGVRCPARADQWTAHIPRAHDGRAVPRLPGTEGGEVNILAEVLLLL